MLQNKKNLLLFKSALTIGDKHYVSQPQLVGVFYYFHRKLLFFFYYFSRKLIIFFFWLNAINQSSSLDKFSFKGTFYVICCYLEHFRTFKSLTCIIKKYKIKCFSKNVTGGFMHKRPSYSYIIF